jgi:2-polyprenyl-3-methyl-5-hydroxy-6-metoxy-1,4-benzoquinol methylase
MDPEDVRRDWAERSGDYSPEYYADIGPNEVSDTIADVVAHYATGDASILEVGCGCGRHLERLRRDGLSDLTGIDVNDDAFAVMADHYPTLAETGTFLTASLEEFLADCPDDAFDAVYSVETLQHVHPDDAWVFDEFQRVTADMLVTAENEGNSPDRGRGEGDVSYVNDEFPLYHRDWKSVFTERGFAQLLREPTSRDTIRVFRVV